MPPRYFKADDLASGMNSPICPSGTHHACLDSSYSLQCSFYLSLNRPFTCLDLKAKKVCSVVLDLSPEAAWFN